MTECRTNEYSNTEVERIIWYGQDARLSYARARNLSNSVDPGAQILLGACVSGGADVF
jgi:hypothetical protein